MRTNLKSLWINLTCATITATVVIVFGSIFPFQQTELTAQQSDSNPRIFYQRGWEGYFVYTDGRWEQLNHELEDPVSVAQMGPDHLVFVDGFINEREEVDVRHVEFQISTRIWKPAPREFPMLRELNNGKVLRSHELDPSEAVYEFQGTQLLRAVQRHRGGYKRFAYLPDGRYLFLYQPFQIGREGPTVIHYSDGNTAPKAMVSRENLFYPRFVNQGSHIVYLNRTAMDADNAADFKLESVDTQSGNVRVIGSFHVPGMSNMVQNLYQTFEKSPYVVIDDWQTLTVYDVRSGEKLDSMPTGDDWRIIPPLNELGRGYSLGDYLLLENYTVGKMQGYRLPNLRPAFEISIPGGPQDTNWATRAVDLPAAPPEIRTR